MLIPLILNMLTFSEATKFTKGSLYPLQKTKKADVEIGDSGNGVHLLCVI